MRCALPMTFALAFLLFGSLCADSGADVHKPESVFIDEALRRIGARSDVYFTIELDKRKEVISPFETTYVDDPIQLKSVDDIIHLIKDDFPRADVVRDKKNPKILHIIEGSLTRLPGYAPDAIEDIRYSGSPTGLAQKLASVTNNAVECLGALVPNGDGDDRMSKISVDVKNCPIRDILSDSLPFQNYSRILWHIQYTEVENREVALVFFGGPIPSKPTPATQPTP
jgi:hypothetical protein